MFRANATEPETGRVYVYNNVGVSEGGCLQQCADMWGSTTIVWGVNGVYNNVEVSGRGLVGPTTMWGVSGAIATNRIVGHFNSVGIVLTIWHGAYCVSMCTTMWE